MVKILNGNTWIKPEDSENLAKNLKSRGANILSSNQVARKLHALTVHRSILNLDS